MKKVITINMFGAGANQRGSSLQTELSGMTWVDEEFNCAPIRKYMKKSWKQSLNDGSPVAKEYRFYCKISISTEKGTRFKTFTIDPKELR